VIFLKTCEGGGGWKWDVYQANPHPINLRGETVILTKRQRDVSDVSTYKSDIIFNMEKICTFKIIVDCVL